MAPAATPLFDPQTMLTLLDDAIEEHGEWLRRWHRAVVTGTVPGRGVMSENAAMLCRFGSWIDLNRGQGLLDQTAFRELDATHAAMHAQARVLGARVGGGQRMPAEAYDAFLASVERFDAQARRLRDAFRKATSDIDSLTGLRNRQTMLEDLQREHERGLRTGAPFCLALADVDHFKRVNDTHGHGVGDLVLRSVAGLFLMHVRPYDTVFRYGGEEFLIGLPNAEPETAAPVLERLREALEQSPVALPDGTSLSVTASFGMACVVPGLVLRDAIERADRALYAAKRQGWNRVAIWSPELGS